MLVDKTSSSVILEFLLEEAQNAGGRSHEKRFQLIPPKAASAVAVGV